MNERGQFTFYRSFWEAVKGLPKKDKLPILEAIISYALDGIVPSGLSQSQSAFFLLVKPNLNSARKKAASGKVGGSKTKGNGKQSESKPEANGKQTPREKENEEEKENEIEIESEKEKKQSVPGSSFTAFWESYPCKIGREKAWEAWKDLSPTQVLVQGIMNALERWKQSEQWLEDGGRFIPRAAKWLSERHFENPPAPLPYSKGGPRVLDEDDIAAIKRMLSEPIPECPDWQGVDDYGV